MTNPPTSAEKNAALGRLARTDVVSLRDTTNLRDYHVTKGAPDNLVEVVQLVLLE